MTRSIASWGPGDTAYGCIFRENARDILNSKTTCR
jgi:hypothetical protein